MTFIGVFPYDCFVPEEHEILRTNLAMPSGEVKRMVMSIKLARKDGSTFPVVTYTSPIYEKTNTLATGSIMIYQAVKRRKKYSDRGNSSFVKLPPISQVLFFSFMPEMTVRVEFTTLANEARKCSALVRFLKDILNVLLN